MSDRHGEKMFRGEQLDENVRVDAPVALDKGTQSGEVLGGPVRDAETGEELPDKRYIAISHGGDVAVTVVDVDELEAIIEGEDM